MLRADGGGSGFYRIVQPALAARGLGVDVTVSDSADVTGWQDWGGRNHIDRLHVDADVLIVQRPLSEQMHAVAVQAQAQGMAVVVEVDDDFHTVHKRNVAHDAVDPAHEPLHNRTWLTRTCAIADALTVSTPRLLKYGEPGGRAVVVRNRLPYAALLHAPPLSPARGVIGWTGTVETHPADMQATKGALAQVDAPIRVVGKLAGVAAALAVPSDRVTLGSGWVENVPAYWAQVARNIGVGIAPLEVSKFNQAKSALKSLEYATLGIPFVASYLPEYQRVVRDSGAGLLASSAGQWARHLRTLLEDDNLYELMRKRGRDYAAQNTLEQHTHEWTNVWEQAMKRRTARQAAARTR